MYKIAFALSAIVAVASAGAVGVVAPLISGVSSTQRVHSNIPLAVTTGLRVAAPVAVASPVVTRVVSPLTTVVAAPGLGLGLNSLGLVNLGLVNPALAGLNLINTGLVSPIGATIVANPAATLVAAPGATLIAAGSSPARKVVSA